MAVKPIWSDAQIQQAVNQANDAVKKAQQTANSANTQVQKDQAQLHADQQAKSTYETYQKDPGKWMAQYSGTSGPPAAAPPQVTQATIDADNAKLTTDEATATTANASLTAAKQYQADAKRLQNDADPAATWSGTFGQPPDPASADTISQDQDKVTADQTKLGQTPTTAAPSTPSAASTASSPVWSTAQIKQSITDASNAVKQAQQAADKANTQVQQDLSQLHSDQNAQQQYQQYKKDPSAWNAQWSGTTGQAPQPPPEVTDDTINADKAKLAADQQAADTANKVLAAAKKYQAAANRLQNDANPAANWSGTAGQPPAPASADTIAKDQAAVTAAQSDLQQVQTSQPAPGTTKPRTPGEIARPGSGVVDTAVFTNDPFTGLKANGNTRYGSPPPGSPPPPSAPPPGYQWIYVQPYGQYKQNGDLWNIYNTSVQSGFTKDSWTDFVKNVQQANANNPDNKVSDPNLIYQGYLLVPG